MNKLPLTKDILFANITSILGSEDHSFANKIMKLIDGEEFTSLEEVESTLRPIKESTDYKNLSEAELKQKMIG